MMIFNLQKKKKKISITFLMLKILKEFNSKMSFLLCARKIVSILLFMHGFFSIHFQESE